MNEFEELLNSVGDVKVGDIVKGEILSVDGDQASVAIVGTGVEGVLTLRELTSDRDADINTFVKSGDELELLVVKQIVGKESEGATVFLLSKKRLDARKAWTALEGKEGEVVTVKVLKNVKGGLSVDYQGVRGFIPASMIDTYFVRDTAKFVGQEVEAKIIEVNASENRFILSRKAVVEESAAEARKEVFAKIAEGSVVEGTVARLTDFGAFVDLGGVDGLVHVTELAHGRVKSPKDVVSVGDKVEVKVLKVDEDANRISLSLKATTPGPWENIEEKAAAGTVLDGVVKRLTDFGAFVEIFPGVEGLVHISQISHTRVENPKDVLSAGQEVKVKVLDVKPEEERVSLSIKALEEAPARAPRNDDEGRSERSNKPRRNNKRKAQRDYELPETQEGFSLADFLGEDFKLD
ncbi:30S ribosomal protein S1 [Streptococcaceae bacterium ESL0729]|nr:30S ribosomal protein S1 [Streptococcaceae bacterium ESL0729]